MNQTIKHKTNRLHPEAIEQVSKMLNTLDHRLAPMREVVAKVEGDFLRQQVHINKLLEPSSHAIEALKAYQANLPDFSETLKALELAKKSAVINVDIFPSTVRRSYQGGLSTKPQVRRREPQLNAEEIAFVKALMDKQESQSIELIAEQVTSVFNWNTFDLHIDGKRIKLEPVEKTICMCVFKNPNTRCMLLDTVEDMVYGAVNPDSKRLRQAIKRINTKIRRAGFDNLFSYAEGFLNVNI